MTRYYRFILIAITLFFSSLNAKQKFDFFFAVKGDSVFIYLNQTPGIGQFFDVFRRGPGEKEFVKLTDTPIGGVTDAASAQRILGSYYNELVTALKLKSPEQLLIRLRTDPYYGQVAMLMDRRAARVLGRFFTEGNHKKGAVYTYRVVLKDSRGEVIAKKEHNVKIREILPMPVTNFRAQQKQFTVILKWDYPKWTGDMKDITFRFMIFRSDRGSAFKRIHKYPLLRLEGFPLQYIDKEIIPGRSYTYRIVAVNAVGVLSSAKECKVETMDNQAPVRPVNLETKELQGRVLLTWSKNREQDIAGYNVFRWVADKKDSLRLTKTLIPASQNSYIDSTITFGTSYFYAVSAVDTAGNESPHSNRMDALVTDRTPPGMPLNFSVEVTGHTVSMKWDPPGDRDLAGYMVRRGFTESKPFNLQDNLITSTSFTDRGEGDKGVPSGHYFYSVVAQDSMGYQSIPAGSWVLIPDDEPPQAPGRVIAANHLGREIHITWNPSISRDAAGYLITRICGKDTAFVLKTDKRTRTAADKDVKPGNLYIYSVTAVDTAGNSSIPTVSDTVFMRDFDPPSAPAFVTAVVTEKGVRIRWEPSGDFDLAGYDIYCGAIPTASGKKLNKKPVQDTVWIHTDGTEGSWYWIKSVDTSGNKSKKSIAVCAKKEKK